MAQTLTTTARRRASTPEGDRRLAIVPARRRAAGFLAVFFVVVALMLLGAAALHTQLAERQYELDRLERSIATAQDQFDDFRRQRAELRAPNRLGEEARRLGLEPAREAEFVAIDPWIVAQAIAATGRVPDTVDQRLTDLPLDQFRAVKSVSAERP